jgi:uncharacterized protein
MTRHHNLWNFNNLIFSTRLKFNRQVWAAVLLLLVVNLACSLSTSPVQGLTEDAGRALSSPGLPAVVVEVQASPTPQPQMVPVVVLLPTPTLLVEAPPTLTWAPESSATPEAAPTEIPPAAPPPAPDPYAHLAVDYLTGRAYGGGQLEVVQVMADNSYFTRYLVRYPSDGLQIYGFMNVPKREPGPYPVIIALHGYIDPAIYTTLDYTTHYADTLARAGFLVLHPNLRNYPPSDEGDNLFRVGMAVDVLNLIGLVRQLGGAPGALEQARPDAVGLWGHSMGGGVALRTAVVDSHIRGVVLYAAMSGDEQQNFEAIGRWSGGQRGLAEREVPAEALLSISPLHYLDRIAAPLSIHHGEADQLVPLQWSLELCQALSGLYKPNECVTYPGQPHTFNPEGSQIFMQNVVDFFKNELK